MSKNKRLNRDHAKKTQRPMVEDQAIAEHLTALLTPVITSQSHLFKELRLRARILTLPVMVAAVLPLFHLDLNLWGSIFLRLSGCMVIIVCVKGFYDYQDSP